jgi:cytochrome c-type biogenesis protein CcmH
MVDRYGEYVLLRPDARGANMVLWFAAPVMLLFALGVGWAAIRRRPVAPEALSEQEQAELDKILRS